MACQDFKGTSIDVVDDEAIEEAGDMVEAMADFLEANPRFRLAAVIMAAIDDETGDVFINEVSSTSEQGRTALKEGDRREVDPLIN